MRLPWLVLLALTGAGPAFAQSATAVDVTGLPVFWAIHDTLAADREPSDTLWSLLWSTPGYRMLEERERRRAALTNAMRLAFKPSLRHAADSVANLKTWTARALDHMREVHDRRVTLESAARSLATPAALDSARKLASKYLRPEMLADAPAPEVSLIYFLDARGYSRILLDPSYLLDLYDPIPVLGHELHHFYRNRHDRSGTKEFGDDMIAWRLATTETEGIAGMVDKWEVPGLSREELERRYRVPAQREYFSSYQVEYRRSEHWLAITDQILRRAAAHPDSLMSLGRELDQQLPDNGRIMGAWMGALIEREAGHEALLAVVGNPWEFWRAYNSSAKRAGAFVMSDDAMRVIGDVERRYR